MLQTNNPTIPSTSYIKVLSSSMPGLENHYLTCLCSSVQSYGVEFEGFYVSRPFAQIKAEQKRGDVIHLHWIYIFCNLSGSERLESLWSLLVTIRNLLFFKFYRGYQLVWTIHNDISHQCSHPLIEKSLRWFLSRICNDIIVMSEYSRQELARTYWRTKRVHIIPHGNYIGVYANQISSAEARRKLGIAPHQQVFLHLGRLMRYKGIDHLLDTFARVKNPDVVLLIAGTSTDSELLVEIEQAAQVDPRIILRLEFIPDDDIQVYMNACNWVVLPYKKILNSGSALLALSFKRPVIVPTRGVLTELISDGTHGLCYARDRELSATINRALATPHHQWEQMCDRAYALAQKFDWSKIGAQLYQIYQR